jgi:hypothetical protein
MRTAWEKLSPCGSLEDKSQSELGGFGAMVGGKLLSTVLDSGAHIM